MVDRKEVNKRLARRPKGAIKTWSWEVKCVDDGIEETFLEFVEQRFGSLINLNFSNSGLEHLARTATNIVVCFALSCQELNLPGLGAHGIFLRENGTMIMVGEDARPNRNTLLVVESNDPSEIAGIEELNQEIVKARKRKLGEK